MKKFILNTIYSLCNPKYLEMSTTRSGKILTGNKTLHENFKEKIKSILLSSLPLLTIFLFTGVSNVKAQLNLSPFQYTTEEYIPFNDGTPLGNQSNDDMPFVGIPIGFNFVFNGLNYSELSISPNGYLSFENANSTTSSPISNLDNVVSGLGADLIAKDVNSSLKYKTTGSAPERVFIVQWKGYKSKTGGDLTTFNFQIRLNESSSRIEFHYGEFFLYLNSPPVRAQVGLRGSINTDFAIRTSEKDEWTNTTEGDSKEDFLYIYNYGIGVEAGPESGMKYTFSIPPDPQPIQLYSFSGIVEKNAVKLNWSTVVEINNDYFEVERSTDGINFQVIGIVKGAGNSHEIRNYEFTDSNLFLAAYYYRLRQYDFNGSQQSFEMIFIKNPNHSEHVDIRVYPNPARRDNINLAINSHDKVNEVSVLLYTIEGKVLYLKTFEAKEINSEMAILDLPALPPKTYYMKIIQGNHSLIKSVVIIP